ncbi:ABC-type Mn2+/Zn2+ transport system, permease component [Desulfuromonas soudanensis]|uniref:High-affinity zinc uptake system membrane protein ZnuB n=1 Tax=Desulfuromonas soudanensis TaxID=1603606 RepID=A0A0M4DAS2_9BACT|nr:zinc ABC transporter permease subunit ZnuB [Desulfuromonas soudanensis]ALC17305.1 ABC-type Mn2+/Zn2+ transport system, permease component [Desulfuromonas soudanensis]
MLSDFLLRALLGGLGVALVAGPFGSFVVWRRLAYFGDTLAHSALLGVALGFLLRINLTLGILVVCQLLALLLYFGQRQKQLASDTLLGIFSHGALSLGLVTLAFMPQVRVDLFSYLFGDILSIGSADLAWIFGGGGLALGGLLWLWKPLLAITVHEDLARVEGVAVDRVNWIFLALIALLVAVMMKVVGLLLVTSLLIIPAATARRFAANPERMAILASLIGCLAVIGGLYGSYTWDTPAGPSIVVAACLVFLLSFLMPQRPAAGAQDGGGRQ